MGNGAKPPTKQTKGSIGFDLYSAIDIDIPGGGNGLIPLNLNFIFPGGCYGRIAPRSGLAINDHISVGGGVIDRDFRGEVKVILFNHGKKIFKIKKGNRIAQLICEKYCDTSLVECEEEEEDFSPSERNTNGFGSTGI